MKNLRLPYVVLAALFLAALPAVSSQVPGLINAQGRLFDGEKLVGGDVKLVLRLFDKETGGTMLYEDTSTVRVTEGVYSTYLGDNTTYGTLANALAKGSAFLEVTANDITYQPREKIVSVPYSLMADAVRPAGVTAEMLGPDSVTAGALAPNAVGAGVIAPGAIGAGHLQDGSVGEAKLADGAVTPPKLSQSYWTTSGNIAEGGKMVFLGSVDNRPLDIRVHNLRALRLEPSSDSPNVIGGHEVNDASPGTYGVAVGGGGQTNQPNRARAEFTVIAGGADNLVSGPHAVIGGGLSNAASGGRAMVGGGRGNIAIGANSVIAGGLSNLVSQASATVGGGHANRAEGYVSVIAGGYGNSTTGQVAVVSGGQENAALGPASFVGGGWMNKATAQGAVVGGGRGNRGMGDYAFVGGGTNNVAVGDFSVIAGGEGNLAEGQGSFAAGRGAHAAHDGSFVWADGSGGAFSSTGPGQFLIRAAGNVGIGTDRPEEMLSVAGRVKAAGFAGSGADLRDVIASNVLPGVLGNEAIKADAAIAPGKIAGTALTGETEFAGALQGRYNQLALRPGSVSLTELKPGLLEQLIVESPLAAQVKALQAAALTPASKLGGVLRGTPAEAGLADGVVTVAHLAPDTLKALGAADALAAELKAHRDEALTYRTEYKGEITGKGANLRLAPAAIRAEHLAPGVLDALLAASPAITNATAAIKAVAEAKLDRSAVFSGDVAGTADKLSLKPGVIGPEHLKPGLLAAAILESGLPAQIAALQEKTLARDTQTGGDVTGPLNAIKLLPEAVVKAAGIEEYTARVAGVERKVTDMQSAVNAAAEKAEAGRLALDARITELTASGLHKGSVLQGQVGGTPDDLKIGIGVIGEKNLSAELFAKLGQPAAFETRLEEALKGVLGKEAVFAGDISGTAGATKLGVGVVGEKNLSPEVIAKLGQPAAFETRLQEALKGVLGRDAAFTGDVTGTASALKIAPGVIMEGNLAPELLAKLGQSSALEAKIAAATASFLPRDTEVSGEVSGPLGAVRIGEGVITEKSLSAELAARLAHPAETQKKLSALADAIELRFKELQAGFLPSTLVLDGAVKGTPSALQIADGVVAAKHLSKEVVDLISRASASEDKLAALSTSVEARLAESAATQERKMEARAADLGGVFDAKLTDAVVMIDRKLDALRIGEGSITEKQLSAEVLARLAAASAAPRDGSIREIHLAPELLARLAAPPAAPRDGSIGEKQLSPDLLARIVAAGSALRDGSVAENHLAPGLLDKAVARSGLAAQIETLRRETLPRDFRLAGDLQGTASAAEIRPGAVTAEKLARGSVTADKIADGSITAEKLAFALPRAAEAPEPSPQGFRVVPHPESPNVMGGHPANNFGPGVIGSVVVGGGNAKHPNLIQADYGTISGGFGNKVAGFDGAIGGGQDNQAGGTAAVIGGGFLNKADGIFPVIGGGAANEALANLSVISGGFSNKVSGAYATIPGGYQNTARGDFSLAAGRRASAAHAGSFVWADAVEAPLESTGNNQFVVRATGGVHLYTNSRLTSGAKLSSGSGSWSMLSDRSAKRDFAPVNADDILARLAAMPLHLWSYTTQADGIRHIGPTAQDFRAAFGLGEEETHISAVDADGVALAAIQALHRKVQARDGELRRLREENDALKARLDAIERRLAP